MKEALMHLLDLRNIIKTYPGTPHPAVDISDLQVESGKLFGLLGSSGCGKTTLLRLIAGFEQPDRGIIILNGRNLSGITPQKRHIGFIFQDYALFPHLSVLDNVLFALKKLPKAKRINKAAGTLELVGMDHLRHRMPDELSGGQQQRVAIARALAAEPDLLLMDEPFSNLDAGLRETTRREVRRILKKAGMDAILVTHDQDEALSFCDKLAVMHAGRIQQVGDPESVYQNPETSFVACFLGRSNLLTGTARGSTAHTELGVIPINTSASGEVLLSIRPEHLGISRSERTDSPVISTREFKGHDITYRVRFNEKIFLVHTDYSHMYQPGEHVEIHVREPAVVIEKGLIKP